jgi:hypothetical protein
MPGFLMTCSLRGNVFLSIWLGERGRKTPQNNAPANADGIEADAPYVTWVGALKQARMDTAFGAETSHCLQHGLTVPDGGMMGNIQIIRTDAQNCVRGGKKGVWWLRYGRRNSDCDGDKSCQQTRAHGLLLGQSLTVRGDLSSIGRKFWC